jgi:2-phosphosulfolactate phosphatase
VQAQRRDLAILCSGDDGAFSLEDTVCAGLLVSHLVGASGASLSDGAEAALAIGRYYADRISDLQHASRWARRLARIGRSADVEACLRRDVTRMVPVIERGAIVHGEGVASPLAVVGLLRGEAPVTTVSGDADL